jgi:hypothetical protein
MKHIPGPWELNPSGLQIRKDTKGDGTFVICNMSPSNYIMHKTRIANALRIVECVNAMEGIANPKELRYFWDRERCVRQVKDSSIENHLFLSKDELQKLGEQYKNQEETPYIETTTGEKVRQKHTGAASEYIGLTIKRNEQDQPKDGPTKKDMEELLSYASKYEQLKEVIQNMVARLDEGSEITLTKDSIIVHALREAIK